MTIGKRLNSGFLAVCLLVLIVGLLGLILSMQVRGLRNVELPMEQNLREVEVSIWETIHAADAFRLTGLSFYEDLYHKQIADVNEFFPKYEALVNTEDEKIYIREFKALWNEAKTAGDRMLALTKAQEEQEKLFFEAVDGADEVLDSDIQAKWSSDDPHRLAKEQAVREVEVSIWEAIHAAHQHVGLSGEVREFRDLYAGGTKETDFAKLMTKQFGDVDEFWPKYKALATARWEKAAIAKFDGFWKQAVRAGNDMLRLHAEADKQFKILYEKVDKADDVIDYKMQAYIQKRIDREDLKANRIRNLTIAVIILSLFFAVAISMRISRSISRPIGKLKDAADEIGKGRLDMKVEVESKDELGDLAAAFNSMAALRKAAEKNLQLFKELLDKSNDSIFINDAETSRILDVNQRAQTNLGYTREELQGMSVLDIETVLTDESAWKEHIMELDKAGFMILEGRHKKKDGTIFPVEISVRNISIENKKYNLAVVRDITERKKEEDKLKRLYEELQEKTEYLERFNRLTVGREMEMIKLKAEVNELLEKAGQPRKYEAPAEAEDVG